MRFDAPEHSFTLSLFLEHLVHQDWYAVFDSIKALVGFGRIKAAQAGNIWTKFEVVEAGEGALFCQDRFSGIPGRFEAAIQQRARKQSESLYFPRFGIAPHKTDTGYRTTIGVE